MESFTNRDWHTMGISNTPVTEGDYSRCHLQGKEMLACHGYIQITVLSVNFMYSISEGTSSNSSVDGYVIVRKLLNSAFIT
jgi:hypothetical protein